MVWWFNNYLNSYQFLAVMLNDLNRLSSLSVTQHTPETQQGDESETFQTCMRDTGSYLRSTVHCGLLQLLEANCMTLHLPSSCFPIHHSLIILSFDTIQSLPHEVCQTSGWYMSHFEQKNCCTNISDYRPLHGYMNFNVSRYCTTLYVISCELTTRLLPPLANTTPY